MTADRSKYKVGRRKYDHGTLARSAEKGGYERWA